MCRVRALGSRAAGEKMGVSWLVGRGLGRCLGGIFSWITSAGLVRINDSKW